MAKQMSDIEFWKRNDRDEVLELAREKLDFEYPQAKLLAMALVDGELSQTLEMLQAPDFPSRRESVLRHLTTLMSRRVKMTSLLTAGVAQGRLD